MAKGRIKKENYKSENLKRIESDIENIIEKIFSNQYYVEVEDKEWTDFKIKEQLSFIDYKNNTEKTIQVLINKLKKEFRKELVIKYVDNSKNLIIGQQHFEFEKLLKIVQSGLNVFLVGPTGSGKTTAAENCAKALKLEFYYSGAIVSEYKLTGFINAQGIIVNTDFRKAYEKGGLFLFDEIDASYPQAILAFNAALANDSMDFPDGKIKKHANFRCIAAANTYGQGADRQYVGRNQLDSATLDRFVFLEWNYDEKLEIELAKNKEWVNHIQKIRRIISDLKIRHILSPRASINGAKLLLSDIEWSQVEEMVIWKGMDLISREKIDNHLIYH